jgi:hypothetical protein
MASRAINTALKARQQGDRSILFWSERGQVCCAIHAPYPGTDSWKWERWRPMREEEMREWTRQTGNPPKCEVCR